jgi:hypothetical protein
MTYSYFNTGSNNAQAHCARRPFFEDELKDWWTGGYRDAAVGMRNCLLAYDGQSDGYTNLASYYNASQRDLGYANAAKDSLTTQLAAANTAKDSLTIQLAGSNNAKNLLQTNLDTCINNASDAAITCYNNKVTTATEHQLALSNAINNCQISTATAIAQQLEQDNIRCAGEKTTARAQQLSEDNTRCANEKTIAIATARAQQLSEDNTRCANEKTSAVATGRAQQKIEDDAACYGANPTTTKPAVFRENILLQTQLISQLQNLVGDTQNKLTINEPFKSQSQYQSQSHPNSQSQYQSQSHPNSQSQSKSKFENTHNIPRTQNLPDLYALNKIYDTSIALSDDPLSYNQVAFDTYMHLQDKKINTLQKNMTSINSQLGTAKNPPIKAFRNMSNSQVLNVEGYPNPTATNNGQPATYRGNGASDYPNYLIYGNNGCLQYNPASPSSNNVPSALSTPGSYSFASCNASKPNQQFYAKQITNINEYNAPIKDINNATYKINNSNNALMGFYVVNPINARDQCLQLNNDGLSVMPCNMDASQRFKPMYRHAIP